MDIRLKITAPFNERGGKNGEWVEKVADHPRSRKLVIVKDDFDLFYTVHKGRIIDEVHGEPEPLV